MKKAKLILFTILFMVLFIPIAKANQIYSIDVDVNIDKYGNANIKETWNMTVDHGTEVYKPMGNMGNSEISNFKVSMNNKEFNYESYWNIDANFSDKAYKNGISSNNELCFGMSKYGHNTYVLTYDVSNIIYNISDAQVLYYKFINDSMDPAPKDFSINIHSYYEFPDELDVWGYGYKGYAYLEDGLIKASNDGNFSSSDYSVLLVKFPLNTFDTTNTLNDYNEFKDVLEKAEEGTFEYDYDEPSFLAKLIGTIMSLLPPIMFFTIITLAFKNMGKTYTKYKRANILEKDVNNFRDIPCNKNIFEGFFLSTVYTINSKKEDFLGALLLKWLKEDQIRIIKTEVKKLFKTETVTAFDISKPLTSSNEKEVEMYNMLLSASKDGILEPNELEKWCKDNYSKYFNWFDDTLNKELGLAKANGKISNETKKEVCSQSFHEEAIKLLGLKKFLKEFSQIDKKEAIEVKLWDEYLIFAQIFGIADQVAKQFEKLYPEVYAQTNNGMNGIRYSDFLLINSVARNSLSSATSARSAARAYSGGGGGFSSGGGGGGSFGGGHGGGCR